MNLVGRKQVSWHELRLTVPADAAVVEPAAQHPLVSSLRVYGHDAADPTVVSFWVMVARQALLPGTSLQQWSDSIIDAAAELSSGVVAETRECFWAADASFRGWQSAGRGVTGYARYLDEIARY